MRICILSYGFDKNDLSESYTAYRLVNELRKKHEIEVLTKDDPCEDYVKKVKCVPVLKNTKYYRMFKVDYFEFIFKAYQYLKRKHQRYDIIQHISPKSFRYPNPICNLKAKFIWGPLGGSIPYPTGFSEIEQRESWVTKMRKSDHLRFYLDPFLINTFKKSCMIITTSKASLMQVPVRFRYKTEILPHGIEPIRLDQEKSNLNQFEEDPFIYYCGRLVPYKGVELLARAFHKYLKTDGANLKLLIAGDGPERHFLKKFILENNLGEKVRLLGRLDRSENLNLMSKSLFCVFPALNEAFGNVNLEAMALGKTIIVSDFGGPADIITDGEDGFKIKADSIPAYIDELALKIKLLHQNVNLRKKMEASAKEKVIREFSYPAIVNKLHSLYEKLSI